MKSVMLKSKIALAGILIIIGILMLIFSQIINVRVEGGMAQMESGQAQVNQVNGLSSMNKYTKPFGKQLTSSGQAQINEGQTQIDYYSSMASCLKVGGIVFIAVGAGVGALCFIRKRR